MQERDNDFFLLPCLFRPSSFSSHFDFIAIYILSEVIYGKNTLRGEKDERVEPSQQRVTVEITFSKVRTEKKSFSFLFSFSFSKIFFHKKKAESYLNLEERHRKGINSENESSM